MDRCAEQADVVILDLSGQRGDPFLPWHWMPVKSYCPSCQLQGLCWFLSVKPLLERMDALERVLPVASMARPDHDIDGVEKAGGLVFSAQLPWVRDTGAGKYTRGLKPLLNMLSGGDADA